MRNPEDDYMPEIKCSSCGSLNIYTMQSRTTKKSYYYKCGKCKKIFAVLKR